MSQQNAEQVITDQDNLIRKELGRSLTNLNYDFQDFHLKFMNRIRDIVRKINEGIAFDEVEEKKEQKDYSKKYGDRNLLPIMESLLKMGKINKAEFDYFYECFAIIQGSTINKMIKCKHCNKRSKNELKTGGILEVEKYCQNLIKEFVQVEPIYKRFLSKIKGIGPIISANLIRRFGYCERFDTVSKLWAYTGNNVDKDGKAPKREKGKVLGFNSRLRAFTWNISDALLKLNKGYYRKLYDQEKEKQLNREYEAGYLHKKYPQKRKGGTYIYPETATKLILGHAHNRALRKVRKRFLSHYWEASRELIGKPCRRTYVEGVLHHSHIINWKEALQMEGCLEKD